MEKLKTIATTEKWGDDAWYYSACPYCEQATDENEVIKNNNCCPHCYKEILIEGVNGNGKMD